MKNWLLFIICFLPSLIYGGPCHIAHPFAVFATLLIETTNNIIIKYEVPLTFNPIPAGMTDVFGGKS